MPPLDKKTAVFLRQSSKNFKADILTSMLFVKSLEQGIIGMNGFIDTLRKGVKAHKKMIRKLNSDISKKEALLSKLPIADKKAAVLVRQSSKTLKADIQSSKLFVKSLEQGIISMNGFIDILRKAAMAHKKKLRKLNSDISRKKALMSKLPRS